MAYKRPDWFMVAVIVGAGIGLILFVVGFPELGWITGR